ncbi:MAG: hypothetical protein HRU09_00410 [Oligoflexales bacterium]|nr:hypothetical protein [Oligoflexales bacterium]
MSIFRLSVLILMMLCSEHLLARKPIEANMQLVESNKATVPSWISLNLEKIYWLEERLEFVFARNGLSNLSLGIKQTQLNTFHSFARTLSLNLFYKLLDQRNTLSNAEKKVLKKLLVSQVDKISYPNFKIADIYYRKWKSQEPGKADSIDVYCLAYLSFEAWQELKKSLAAELDRHSNERIRQLESSL